MARRSFILELFVVAVMCLPGIARASLQVPEGLEESTERAEVVIIGEILKAPNGPIKPSQDSALLWEYRIKVLESIIGNVIPQELQVVFAEPDFSAMATQGRLPFSPIVRGSGLEKKMRVGEKFILMFDFPLDFEKPFDGPATLDRAEPTSRKSLVMALLDSPKGWQIIRKKAPEICNHISIAISEPEKGLLGVLVPHTKAIRVYIVNETSESVHMQWVNGIGMSFNQLSLIDGYVVLRQNDGKPILLEISKFHNLDDPNFKQNLARGGDPGEFKK